MPDDLHSLTPSEMEDLKTDKYGNLYWRGKKIKTGGWSTGDRIALGVAIVAVLTLLVGFMADFENIANNYKYITGRVAELWPGSGRDPAAGGRSTDGGEAGGDRDRPAAPVPPSPGGTPPGHAPSAAPTSSGSTPARP